MNTIEKSPITINIVSVDTNVEKIEDNLRLLDLRIDLPDNESYPIDPPEPEPYPDGCGCGRVIHETDISDRRERTIAILDHLNKDVILLYLFQNLNHCYLTMKMMTMF